MDSDSNTITIFRPIPQETGSFYLLPLETNHHTGRKLQPPVKTPMWTGTNKQYQFTKHVNDPPWK